ncbi:MAG: ribose transport system substrate-binding protein [Petroclostridium sp.]|nr:LacI family transcriptional regulator [Clostridia bacterium]MDK2810577.1 ribose transport system substrate-binding protein [Petroclostridium sp.]
MNRITLVSLLIISVILVSIIAGQNNIITKSTSNDRRTVYMIVKSSDPNNEFWQIVRMGAETAAKEFNGDLVFTGPQSETNIQGQIDILADAIQKKPAAIVLAAADYKAVTPMAEKAVKEKIPLITIDSEIDSKAAKSFIATDNITAAEAIGEKLAQLINRKGKVAIVSHIQGTTTAMEREKGFMNTVSKYKDIEIIGKFYSKSSPEEAYRITKQILREIPDIAGIFGSNQQSAEGVARAVNDSGMGRKIKIVAFDSSEEQIQYIEKGIIQAVAVQKPFNMGYLGVKTALMAARGEKVEKNIDTGFEIITKENMYSPENQKLLFPFVER